jgi:hypothetical protein
MAKELRRPVAKYCKMNIHLTTSGYFTLPPLEVVGIERLMCWGKSVEIRLNFDSQSRLV